MPRWIGRNASFTCVSCNRAWTDIYWVPGDTAAYLADIGDKTYVDNMKKLQCVCPSPHVTVSYSLPGTTKTVQVRASQRAVVYEAPDGTWQAPGSNDLNDPIAVRAAHDGYVRREFYSIRELRSFQRSHSQTHGDDTTASNEVLDFDEASRRQGDTLTRDRYATQQRENRLREAFNLLGLQGNSGRYDRVLKERSRR